MTRIMNPPITLLTLKRKLRVLHAEQMLQTFNCRSKYTSQIKCLCQLQLLLIGQAASLLVFNLLFHLLRLDVNHTRLSEVLDHIFDDSPGEEENQLGEAQQRASYDRKTLFSARKCSKASTYQGTVHPDRQRTLRTSDEHSGEATNRKTWLSLPSSHFN